MEGILYFNFKKRELNEILQLVKRKRVKVFTFTLSKTLTQKLIYIINIHLKSILFIYPKFKTITTL